MKLVYPVCFYEEDDGRFSAIVPDLPGCATFGANFAEALEMATDAACGWILLSMEEGDEIPPPSRAKDIHLEYKNGFINHILLDIGAYAKLHENYTNQQARNFKPGQIVGAAIGRQSIGECL
ncbi:MAG: type II toxin-antitoxin system HicB family antitoxin [Defluviitaleaceae bacterium]|nr:type II toxin-antitoxin system HicB family antitoxin [Defluviitaleaceae bacterium]